MDWLHIHLALNHISVIGFPFLFLLLVTGAFHRDDTILRLAIRWIAIFAVISIALKFTGDFAAEQAGPKLDSVRAYVNAHEQSADQATTSVFLTGLAAAITAFLSRRGRPIPKWPLLTVFLLTFVTCALLARTARIGGQITHPELR
jgi:hypothetical protein